MSVFGSQDRDGGFDDGRIAHSGVKIAGGERGGGGAADSRAALRCAQEGRGLAVILGGHRPGKVERGAGDVGVDIHATGEDEHAGCVDHAAALDLRHDPAVRDAKILDHTVDAIRGIVDLPAGDSQHGVSVGWVAALPAFAKSWPSRLPGRVPTGAWPQPPDGCGG